jgi:hypothetical protein
MARRTVRRWTQVGIGLAAGTLVAAAALALPADAPLGPSTATAAMQLKRFDNCDAVTAWYIKQALPLVTAWGLGGPPVYYFDGAFARTAMPLATSVDARDEAVGSSATGTNVQEQGVDEPDIAKLMGDLVVSVENHTLTVTDVSGATPSVVSTVELPDNWMYELLVVGDRVLLTGTRHAHSYGRWEGDMLIDSRFASPWAGYGDAAAYSSLTTVDLSDPTGPQVVNRDVIEGTIATSREHDGTVRVVATTAPTLDFVYPTKSVSKKEALAENRQIIRDSSASDWLPWRAFDKRGNGGQPLVSCSEVGHPEVGAGLGTISVVTLDPADPANLQATAVSADGSLVYASASRLYVATVEGGLGGWTLMPRVADPDWRNPDTEIHAFATDGDTTTYVASGTVDGVAPDRWAFSEDDGLLRVATSLGSSWSPRESVVTVLQENGNTLTPMGEVGGLGVNEQIKAVRWFGDYAVVVTFRQVDPLYLIDLSDPAKPTILDSLKVPGFSEYLHPVGDDVILGVGQGNARGWGAVQVSSFDVSDLRRIDQLPFAGADDSAVAYDSRAFTYLPDLRLALIPTHGWRDGSTTIQIVSVALDGRAVPGALSLVRTVSVDGANADVRTLPLSDGRVALVTDGEVDQVLSLDVWPY